MRADLKIAAVAMSLLAGAAVTGVGQTSTALGLGGSTAGENAIGTGGSTAGKRTGPAATEAPSGMTAGNGSTRGSLAAGAGGAAPGHPAKAGAPHAR